MVKELEKFMSKFSISEEELDGINLDKEDIQKVVANCQKSLLGKVIGEKQINFVSNKSYANQIWNLHLHWVAKETGFKIGKKFKEIKDVVVSLVEGKEGKHIKMLVEVDITKPLLRGFLVRSEGDQKWVNFRYEKLPNFCFHYGIIGHSIETCTNRKSMGDSSKLQFGSWLNEGSNKIVNGTTRKEVARAPSNKDLQVNQQWSGNKTPTIQLELKKTINLQKEDSKKASVSSPKRATL
ncbi:hypothetical protein ACH5RR_041004 [Cinchona calisaya]|uniref:Zinc knuckle CX2CX4HX4C domain-containing protein n=1 Tax=Cinchona calisaya TaxID=153742 RepID=A0ABD2XXJ3_9GENT